MSVFCLIFCILLGKIVKLPTGELVTSRLDPKRIQTRSCYQRLVPFNISHIEEQVVKEKTCLPMGSKLIVAPFQHN